MENGNKSERLFSLDLLRGLDMFLLTVIGPLVWAVNVAWPLPGWLTYQFDHPWEGFTLWDIIMPLFLFMSGASMPFSLERRLARNGGRPDAGYWKHVAWRFCMLWGLGLIVQGRLLDFSLDRLRLYDNTLETIACGFLAMAFILLVKSMKVKIAIAAGCFIVYGVLLHCLGDYSLNGNFAGIVEQNLLMKIVPATSETMKEITSVGLLCDPAKIPVRILAMGSEVHYTWYLTSLMFVFMVAAGYFATKILTSTTNRVRNALRLFAFGAALLVLGWILAFCGVGMVKHVFTVSFTAQAMGWSALALAAAYYLTDVLRMRGGLSLFILFGRTSLVCYLIGEFFWPCFVFVGRYLTGSMDSSGGYENFVRGGLSDLLGGGAAGIVATLIAIALMIACLEVRVLLRERKGK